MSSIFSGEYRLYFRDLFFFLITCSISVFVAEYFIFTDSTRIPLTTRLFTYAYLIIPLTLVVMVLSYNYRSRRIERTGVIRSSIRYKLIIAFIFVSILPSIPIMLLSGDLIEKSIARYFSIDVRRGLDAGIRIADNQIEKERAVFLNKLKNAGLFQGNYKESYQFFRNIGFLEKDDYFALVKGKKIRKENTNLLKGVYSNLEFTSLKKEGLPNVSEGEFGTTSRSYRLFRLKAGDRSYLFGKIFAERVNQDLVALQQTAQAWNSADFFKGDVSLASQIGLFMTSILLVLAAVIVSFNLARQISEPLMSLAVATRRITEGNYEQKIDLQATGEMGVLIDSFNQMVDSIANYKKQIKQSQRLSVWKEVAQRVAHEIKNPLTPIQLNAERLRRKIDKGSDKELVEFTHKSVGIIIQEVDIIKRLVNEFSQFARMPNPKREPCDINGIFREVAGAYEDRDSLKFIIEYDESFPMMNLDRGMIHQVFTNLVKNSIEAMTLKDGRLVDDAVIDVRFYTTNSPTGRIFCLTFEDNGPPVPVEIREKLFEPYFSTKKEGTGIGLAISEKILVDHGGRITVENSEKYTGLKFEIQFEEDRV